MIDDIFKSGVVIDEKTKEIALAVNPDDKIDEGDFRLIDIALSARRVELLSDKQPHSEINIKLEQLTSFLLILSQLDAKKNDKFFVIRHYQAFYKHLYNSKLTPALLNYTLQSLKDKQINKWIANNRKQVENLKSAFVKFNWK